MTYSPALPEAMGYTVELDTSAGYGVTRMLLSGTTVWNPRDDSAQCFEVLAWLVRLDEEGKCDRMTISANGDMTAAGLRAAIVEAAERVAQS